MYINSEKKYYKPLPEVLERRILMDLILYIPILWLSQVKHQGFWHVLFRWFQAKEENTRIRKVPMWLKMKATLPNGVFGGIDWLSGVDMNRYWVFLGAKEIDY